MLNEPQVRDVKIVELVNKAKDGCEISKALLFENFKWFLRKYKNLLTDGPTHLNEKDVRHFMSLFVTSKYRGILLSGKINKDSQIAINQKISELRGQYMELGKEDVESIVDLTFFQCLDVYDELGKVRKECRKHGIDYDELSKIQKKKWEKKYPPVGFEGFILNYFKYLLKKNLDKETKGIVPGIGWCQPLTSEEIDIDYINEDQKEDDHYDIDETIGLNIEFNSDWVNGKTATWPFSELTTQERWLLKNRYEDKNYAIKLSEMTGSSPTQIRKKISDIKLKLNEIIKANQPQRRD